METQPDSTNEVIKPKQTRKPKGPSELERLQDVVLNLQAALSKIAVMTGQGNTLREFNIEVWQPNRKDMTRQYK